VKARLLSVLSAMRTAMQKLANAFTAQEFTHDGYPLYE
jgi:hypothetical protein